MPELLASQFFFKFYPKSYLELMAAQGYFILKSALRVFKPKEQSRWA
jgi:hypothetical protein